jgi:DNA-binding transcriptional LysR family regulator
MKDAIARSGLASSGLASRSVNLCNNARMMIDIVRAGGGIGIFPRSMVQQLLAEGSLMQIPGASDLPPVEFQVAIRAAEMDPAILHIFERASRLDISDVPRATPVGTALARG